MRSTEFRRIHIKTGCLAKKNYMSYDIFIVFVNEDAIFVSKLAQALTKLNLNVQLAEVSLPSGNDLSDTIATGLEDSRAALVVLSQKFMTTMNPLSELKSLARVATFPGSPRPRIVPLSTGLSRSDIQMFLPELAAVTEFPPWVSMEVLANNIRRKIDGDPLMQPEIPPDDRRLRVLLDPGNASEELLTEFYVALSAYYRSLGGSGLSIKKDERRALVGEAVS